MVAILAGVRPSPATESPANVNSDPAQWRAIALARAQTAAAEIQEPYRQGETLAAIARAQASVAGPAAAEKIIGQALAVASRIQADEFRGWVLNEIVSAQLAADDLAGATQTAESIGSSRPREPAFVAIANVHVRLGNLARAQALAQRIRDSESRGEVLRQIVSVHCSKGDIAAAKAMLPTIDDPHFAAMASGDIAAAQVKQGELSAALKLASRARRPNRDEVHARIASAQAERGDFSGADKTLQLINDPVTRALVQGRLALQRLERDDTSDVRESLTAAAATVRTAREKSQTSLKPAAQLARWQLIADDSDVARETLRRLRAEAEQLPAGHERDELLDYIGRSQARAGDAREAIAAARNINDRVMRALLVRDAVSLDPDASAARATVWAREFSDPLVEAAAQFGVISMQTYRGGQQPSPDTIAAAHAAVRRIDDRELLPAAYAALAAVRARADDIAGGQETFQQALAAAEALGRSEQIAAACIRIVEALDDRLLFLGRAADKMDEPH